MKTLFVAAGPYSWGSSRMRCYWPARCLDGAEVATFSEFERWAKYANQADAFIWQKNFSAEYKNWYPNAQHYWDVCDPAWWWEPDACREVVDVVAGVVASSPALAEDFNEWYGSEKAVCIPDRLDLEHFPIQRQHTDVSPVRFIWYGVAVNRIAIMAQLANLERLVANGHKIELTIFDDRPDHRFIGTDAFPVYHVAWSVERENEVIAAHDIALLPPYPGPWGDVKSNNKRLTAWACGLPVVDEQDYRAVAGLVASIDDRKMISEIVQANLKESWTVDRSAREWQGLLCK